MENSIIWVVLMKMNNGNHSGDFLLEQKLKFEVSFTQLEPVLHIL
jgi:hypothetical protein